MRIAVTGAGGMLGSALCDRLKDRHEIIGLTHKDLDILDKERVGIRISNFKPDIVIHCAAYTDVDGCESDPDRAYSVNGLGTRNIALACAETGATMVYISTDYVFDGRSHRPYTELDNPNPINTYGLSKLMGERYVQSILNRCFIVRTSWLFGRNGKNFVRTVLRLVGEQRGAGILRVVDDQVGTPTYTSDLAEKIEELLVKGGYGIYHVTNSGYCSWYEFALKIIDLSGIHNVKLEPIKSWEAGRLADRPNLSVLENMVLRLEGIEPLRRWEDALSEYLKTEIP